MVNVTKKNGESQEFKGEKVISSCMKAGATKEIAEKIAAEISSKAHEGISTSEIKTMVMNALRAENAAWADSYVRYVKAQA